MTRVLLFIALLASIAWFNEVTGRHAAPIAVAADAMSVLTLVAAIACMGLVFLWTGASVRARSAVGALACAAWMVWAGGLSAAILLVLLAAFYGLLRIRSVPALALGFVAVAFLAFKGGVIALFADPGAFGFLVPIGFAFFVIRATDLALRVATGEIPVPSMQDYFRYLLFPATFVAGPIQTWPQFRDDVHDQVDFVDWTAGLARILVGVGKKMLANILHAKAIAPKVVMLAYAPDSLTTIDLWTLLVAQALYVYIDFSAYSDIAIGAGRQLGWRVPENFDLPFAGTNMREFWKRWHMSVSGWVMRWVHLFAAFPLRRSARWAQRALPVIVSMTVIGMWHEPNLTWFLWGLHHAAGILLAGTVARLPDSTVMRVGGMGFVLGWVSLSHAFTLVGGADKALALYARAIGVG